MAAVGKALRRLGSPIAWLFRRLLLNHWKAIDDEVSAEEPKKGYDWRPIVVLITVAFSLTMQEYWGQRGHYQQFFPRVQGDEYFHLKTYAWWTGWRFFGYVLLPTVVILLMPGERLGDYFIRFTGFIKHLWIYVTLFALIAPMIYLASKTSAFQATYPFYKMANRSSFDFWAWEGMYALQFLSLEFFFRGFMLRGLRSAFSSKAIFVMAVPYCMIHYGKPMPETIGAIFAGIILGTLAMRTKTIWGGVAIHISVATMMDALAVGHCPPADSGEFCRGH